MKKSEILSWLSGVDADDEIHLVGDCLSAASAEGDLPLDVPEDGAGPQTRLVPGVIVLSTRTLAEYAEDADLDGHNDPVPHP